MDIMDSPLDSPWACQPGAYHPGLKKKSHEIELHLLEQQAQLNPVTRPPASLTQETHRRQLGLVEFEHI